MTATRDLLKTALESIDILWGRADGGSKKAAKAIGEIKRRAAYVAASEAVLSALGEGHEDDGS